MLQEQSPGRPRILLVKLSSLGDVLHALPTLEALRAAYPQGQITWLVEAPYAPLLSGHPALDEVWPVPRVRAGRNFRRSELAEIWRLMRQARALPFDLVIDLQGLLKSALWVALARSPRKVGYHRTREASYLALTERVPPYDPDAHAVERYLNLAYYLGAPPTLPRFRFGPTQPVDPAKFFPVDSLSKTVALHPGARWASKLWPAARWAQLADWLQGDRGLQVVITGSGADRELISRIIGRMRGQAINLAGCTSLRELMGILAQSSLAVTTDTGPMHLAAALGKRVVALFGPTAPWRTGPFGPGHEIVRLGLKCSPCFKRRCDEPRCLMDLSVEAVKAACEKVLFSSQVS